MNKRRSYTAAGVPPLKLLANSAVMQEITEHKHLSPIHAQLIPTNRCNLACSFCSCSNRTKNQEMPIEEFRELIPKLAGMGCKAVTITGGGEPTLHPDIDEILFLLDQNNIKSGMVSNGRSIDNCYNLDLLTWCRISIAAERDIDELFTNVRKAVDRAPNIDWAFSYVVDQNSTPENLYKYIVFGNELHFTHIRAVSDLLSESIIMDNLRLGVQKLGNDDLVIWQDRKDFSHGNNPCYISLLKPLIGPDGFVYPCCGVQYAQKEPSLDLTPEMSMGHWRDMPLKVYNGSECYKCYYSDYNDFIGYIIDDYKHLEFI